MPAPCDALPGKQQDSWRSFAKTLQESWGDVTPEMILEAFRSSVLSQQSFPEVVSDQNREYDHRNIYSHLKTLFNLSILDRCAKTVLCCATLITERGMDVTLFCDSLCLEEKNSMKRLIKLGWLDKTTENLLLIHPVICEICREELNPANGQCIPFLKKLRDNYDPYNFIAEKYIQMASCFSTSADNLLDTKGSLASFAGKLWIDLGDYQRSLHYFTKALEYCEKLQPNSMLKIASSYSDLGHIYGKIGNYEKEIDYARKALKIRKKILPAKHRLLAASYEQVGCAYDHLGYYEDFLQYSSQNSYISLPLYVENYEIFLQYELMAMEILEQILPDDHIDLARIYSIVGIAYGKDAGNRFPLSIRLNAQLQYQLKALSIYHKGLYKSSPQLALLYNDVGKTYYDLNDYETSLFYLLKAVESFNRIYPHNHPDLNLTYRNISSVYCALGKYSEAVEYFEKSLALCQMALPSDHPELANAYYKAGIMHEKLNN